jgi:TrpR-related protein YerC/YecD
MKHRDLGELGGRAHPSRPLAPGLGPLLEALLAMRTPVEMKAFLDDLCTPAEIEAIADRWRVVPLLLEDRPYREIHDRTGVSVTTIGRIARCLSFGAGGYRLAAGRLRAGGRKGKGAR